MGLSKKDLLYWHREFKHLLSGWNTKTQIQFHRYAIRQLQQELEKRGTK